MTDIIIIGAGCAGLTAALYAARAGKSVLVLEGESIGGQIASSPRVENYPGIMSLSGLEFADRLCEQAQAQGAELDFATVTGIRPGTPAAVLTENREYVCRSIILATGARHRELGLPRERELAGVSYCAVCDGAFYRGEDVAVIGGGSAALQSAMYLAGICRSVTVIHRRASFRGETALAKRLEQMPNVTIEWNSIVASLEGNDKLNGIRIRDTKTGTEKQIPVAGVFVLIGQQAQNEAFRGQVELDENGCILAGENCITSAPGVFAAGDCRRKKVRQLATAAGDGTTAALAACAWADEK